MDVILDVNDHNDCPKCDDAIALARAEDRHSKCVNHVVKLDSAASQLLQLANDAQGCSSSIMRLTRLPLPSSKYAGSIPHITRNHP